MKSDAPRPRTLGSRALSGVWGDISFVLPSSVESPFHSWSFQFQGWHDLISIVDYPPPYQNSTIPHYTLQYPSTPHNFTPYFTNGSYGWIFRFWHTLTQKYVWVFHFWMIENVSNNFLSICHFFSEKNFIFQTCITKNIITFFLLIFLSWSLHPWFCFWVLF